LCNKEIGERTAAAARKLRRTTQRNVGLINFGRTTRCCRREQDWRAEEPSRRPLSHASGVRQTQEKRQHSARAVMSWNDGTIRRVPRFPIPAVLGSAGTTDCLYLIQPTGACCEVPPTPSVSRCVGTGWLAAIRAWFYAYTRHAQPSQRSRVTVICREVRVSDGDYSLKCRCMVEFQLDASAHRDRTSPVAEVWS
jgi:hypothetical protein